MDNNTEFEIQEKTSRPESPDFGKSLIQPMTDRSNYEPLVNLSQISNILVSNLETEVNIFESNFMHDNLNENGKVEDHPCFKRQDLKEIMKQKKELKKLAKHFEKKIEILQNDVEELTMTKMDLQKEFETLTQNVGCLEQDATGQQNEYKNLIQKNTILENEIMQTVNMIAKKVPAVKNLTVDKFHTLAN